MILKILPGVFWMFCIPAFADCDMSLTDRDTWEQARPKWQCMVDTLKQKDQLLQQQKQALAQKDQQLNDAQVRINDYVNMIARYANSTQDGPFFDWLWSKKDVKSQSDCIAAAARVLTRNNLPVTTQGKSQVISHRNDGVTVGIFCGSDDAIITFATETKPTPDDQQLLNKLSDELDAEHF